MEHITINTTNLENSIVFYTDVIGLTVRLDLRNTANLPIVFLSANADDTAIELIENKENPYAGSGISIGFQVHDVEASHKEMTEKGLNPSPIISPNPNTKFFFIKDPNGLNIQLIN